MDPSDGVRLVHEAVKSDSSTLNRKSEKLLVFNV